MEKYVIDIDKFGLSNKSHETNQLIGDIVEMVYGCCDDSKYLVTDENGLMLGYQKNEEHNERDELFKLLFELRDINRMLFGVTRTRPTQQEIESSKQRKIEIFDELQKRLKHQPIAFITPTEMIINEQFLQQDQVATTEPQQDENVPIFKSRYCSVVTPISKYKKYKTWYYESDNVDDLVERGICAGIVEKKDKVPFLAFAKAYWHDERFKKRSFVYLDKQYHLVIDDDGKGRFLYNLFVLKACYEEWKEQSSTTADNKREKNEPITNNAKITDINIVELEEHFKSKFKNKVTGVYLMGRLIDELKMMNGTKTDVGRVAKLIFDSEYFIKDYNVFSKWLDDFFRIVGLECPHEKSPNKYKPTEQIESIFSFLK